jgi:hypothetical protein
LDEETIIMIRLSFNIIAFLCVSGSLLAQDTDSFTNIKGYYVTRFLKSEISSSFNEKIKKSRNESFLTPIDFSVVSFFIPIQIGTKIIYEDKQLSNILINENNLNKDSIYYLPIDEHKRKLIKYQTNGNVNLEREHCILSEVGSFSPFYSLLEDKKFLFKIVYLEGTAFNKRVQNIESERFKLGIDVYSINKKAVNLDLFLITHIDNYSTIVKISKTRVWFPYL